MSKVFHLVPLALAACGLLASPATAQTPNELKVGDAAPDFTAPVSYLRRHVLDLWKEELRWRTKMKESCARQLA